MFKTIYRVNTIFTKIPMVFSTTVEKLIVKTICHCKAPQMANLGEE